MAADVHCIKISEYNQDARNFNRFLRKEEDSKMENPFILSKTASKAIIDPVCGMSVSAGKRDIVSSHQGSSYYFCAEACRKAFEKDPSKFLASKPPKRKGLWGRYLDRLNKATGGKPPYCH